MGIFPFFKSLAVRKIAQADSVSASGHFEFTVEFDVEPECRVGRADGRSSRLNRCSDGHQVLC